MTVFVFDDFDRVGQILKDNAFFFSFFDFYHIRRHFVLGSSVDIIDFLRAESDRGSACVHRGVAAADDRDLFAHADFFVSDNLTQEINTADHAFRVLTLAAYAGRYPRADAKEYRVEIRANGFKRNIHADLGIGDDFHAHHFDGCDFFI